MPKPYNPANWYWAVAGSVTQVYSSALGNYVQATDPTFVAWKEDGTVPTPILNEAELGEVLAPYNLRPVAPQVLDGYKDLQARELTIAIASKILFAMANEIQALKGLQPLTPAQFRTWVKGLM